MRLCQPQANNSLPATRNASAVHRCVVASWHWGGARVRSRRPGAGAGDGARRTEHRVRGAPRLFEPRSALLRPCSALRRPDDPQTTATRSCGPGRISGAQYPVAVRTTREDFRSFTFLRYAAGRMSMCGGGGSRERREACVALVVVRACACGGARVGTARLSPRLFDYELENVIDFR
jgi:hypothetical protein